MLRFIRNAYKEIYAWLFYNTDLDLLSFSLSYLTLVLLQLLNAWCIIIFTQRLLGIALIEFLLTQKIAITVFVAFIFIGNYVMLGSIWRKKEPVKDVNNRAFAYISISLVLGVIGFLLRP